MKDIKGWEGQYAITKEGRVWSYPREWKQISRWGTSVTRKWRGGWLKANTNRKRNWYYSIALGKKNRKGYKIHRLIAEAFIPNPLELPEVNHKNGIKTDNRIENLEWCDHTENIRHAHRIGLVKVRYGAENKNARLTQMQAEKIREIYSKKAISQRTLGARFGVSFATVGEIIRGRIYLTDGSQSLPSKRLHPRQQLH